MRLQTGRRTRGAPPRAPNVTILGCLFLVTLLSSPVEAQEGRVLQCEVRGWVGNSIGRQTGYRNRDSFRIEFISNGRAVLDYGDLLTPELTVTTDHTKYIFRRYSDNSLLMTVDRLTGALSSVDSFDEDHVVHESGICRPVRVVPKL
jgi:hypothetical protein